MSNYIKPITSEKNNIAACLITPFKSRVVTFCAIPALMAV